MLKKILVMTLALGVIGFSLSFAQPIKAQNPVTTLVDKIAEKFNLNRDEVQKVADDFRTEKMNVIKEQKKENLEVRLSQAVTDGKITEVQKQAILKKMDELQKERESHRAEMEAWIKENDLEGKFKFGIGHFGMGKKILFRQ